MPDNIKMGMTLPVTGGGVVLDWVWCPDSDGEAIIALMADPDVTLPFVLTTLYPFSVMPFMRFDRPERYDSLRDVTIMLEAVAG